MDPLTRQVLSTTGGKKSTYLEDIFSNYVYIGTGASGKAVNNNIDLSGKGGLAWIKRRDGTNNHILVDSAQGATKYTSTNTITAPTTDSATVSSFSSTGFVLGSSNNGNGGNDKYTSSTFRKEKGFFTIVEWTGNGVAGNTVSHDLGCVPGCMIVRRITSGGSPASSDWTVYHTSLGGTKSQRLNAASATATGAGPWNDTAPTDSVITLGSSADTNENNSGYIAYVFAGANVTRWSDMISPASGTFDQPASLAFDGYLGSTTNRLRTSGNAVVCTMTISPAITIQAGQSVVVYGEDYSIGNPLSYNGTATVTIDGTTYTSSTGAEHTFSTSGQLTQITYVNNSGSGRTTLEGIRVNGDLLTDGSFFVNGNPNYTEGAESKFGEDEDQSLIKCGEYKGNSSSTGPSVHLGWQAQWVMIKKSTGSQTAADWYMIDTMRGIVSGGDDAILEANTNAVESANAWNLGKLTSTGFQIEQGGSSVNESGETYLYIAIRGGDGYVSQPVEAGTDAFAMDVGNGSNVIPPGTFDSGWPVELGLMREPASNSQWYTTTRLQGYGYLRTNDTDDEAQGNPSFYKGSNVGWGQDTYSTNWMSWMWKRGASFDTVAYSGNGAPIRKIHHGLGRVPEMMWVKRRNSDGSHWRVYHKGLNGGTNPAQYRILLDSSDKEELGSTIWNNTAPTSTYFTVGDASDVNNGSGTYVAILFASVTGISSLGGYTGNGQTGSNGPFVTTGFQPRFIVTKRIDGSGSWYCYDSLRGFGTVGGNHLQLTLNGTGASNGSTSYEVSSTGFRIVDDSPQVNGSGSSYLYYAHA